MQFRHQQAFGRSHMLCKLSKKTAPQSLIASLCVLRQYLRKNIVKAGKQASSDWASKVNRAITRTVCNSLLQQMFQSASSNIFRSLGSIIRSLDRASPCFLIAWRKPNTSLALQILPRLLGSKTTSVIPSGHHLFGHWHARSVYSFNEIHQIIL